MIEPGARLAVVGPNGSGKTTLLDIIAGRREAALGTVKVGTTVVVGYADQHSTSLDPDITVRKMVAGPLREPDHEDKALLERFWFDSTAQYAPVRMLSGGEKRRLQLVMVLARQPNLLILDEPTNDLDLDTLRSLEDFLDDWPGALVVASHDRAFLDRVADHVLAIEPGWDHATGSRWCGRLARRAGGTDRADSLDARVRSEHGGARRGGKPKPERTGPSPSTIGRRLRETEQAMVKAQKRVDALHDELATTHRPRRPGRARRRCSPRRRASSMRSKPSGSNSPNSPSEGTGHRLRPRPGVAHRRQRHRRTLVRGHHHEMGTAADGCTVA